MGHEVDITFIASKVEPHTGRTYLPDEPDAILTLETRVGSLPPGMRELLSTYGRCGFSGFASVKFENGHVEPIFTLFDTATIVDDCIAHSDFEEGGFIPVADDEFNNRYLFSQRDGAVHFAEYANGSCVITRVASSFEAFLRAIEVDPSED